MSALAYVATTALFAALWGITGAAVAFALTTVCMRLALGVLRVPALAHPALRRMSRRLREPATAGMASARAQELPRLIHPLTPLLAFVAPLLFLAWVLPESSYELLYRTPK